MVKMGRRVSIQLITGLAKSLLVRPAMTGSLSRLAVAGGRLSASTDFDLGVGLEGVRRQRKVGRRRPMTHPPRGIVLAAVAGAEPAAPVTARIRRLVAEWHAAKVGADADEDDPLV